MNCLSYCVRASLKVDAVVANLCQPKVSLHLVDVESKLNVALHESSEHLQTGPADLRLDRLRELPLLCQLLSEHLPGKLNSLCLLGRWTVEGMHLAEEHEETDAQRPEVHSEAVEGKNVLPLTTVVEYVAVDQLG